VGCIDDSKQVARIREKGKKRGQLIYLIRTSVSVCKEHDGEGERGREKKRKEEWFERY
jgi:hypothetical protein